MYSQFYLPLFVSDCTAETAWSGSLTLSNYGTVSIINCCIKIPNNKNANELNLSQWPKKLRMFTTNRLSFEKMVFQVPRIEATSVIFVVEDASLDQLSKCLTDDKVGFVMIPPSTSNLSHNILILRNTKLRHLIRGIIPKDQVNIVNVVREFLKKEICEYFNTSVS